MFVKVELGDARTSDLILRTTMTLSESMTDNYHDFELENSALVYSAKWSTVRVRNNAL